MSYGMNGWCKEIPTEKRTEKRTETHACDCISRQAAIDAVMNDESILNAMDSVEDGEMHRTKRAITRIIAGLPSAQPEIVQCKDCKWFNDIGCAIYIVDDSDKPTENDYCSYGERKDG